MKTFILLLLVLFQVNAQAYDGEEGCTAPIDFDHFSNQVEGEQLIIVNRFILKGLCYLENEQPEQLFARQAETAQRFADSFSTCDDRLTMTARTIALTNTGYGSPEAVSYSLRTRNRALVQAIDRRCPPQLGTNELTAYIYGEDLFTYEQLRTGMQCTSSQLFVMGLRLRYIRDLSYEDYVERFRLRYISSEISEQRFRQLGERRLQVQRDLESHCHVAMSEDNRLRRRYEGEIIAQ